MTTLRSAYFRPLTGTIELYVSEDGFARSEPLTLTELPDGPRQLADGALQWLSVMLPNGMQALSQVILERHPNVPSAWSEPVLDAFGNVVTPAIPTAWSPSFSISATGQGPKGETTISLNSIPGPITEATAQLWDFFLTHL